MYIIINYNIKIRNIDLIVDIDIAAVLITSNDIEGAHPPVIVT